MATTSEEYVTLTDSQIDEIISEIPQVPSISPSVSKHHTKERNDKLRDLLKENPMPIRIFKEFKAEIIRSYYESLIAPGTPVGGIAAGSVSADATQMNLSAYHTVGMGGGGGSLNSMLEIYMRKKDRVVETMVMHFKDYNMSEVEVREKLYTMEGITIRSLLNPTEDMEIMKNVENYSEVAPWYETWETSTNNKIPNDKADYEIFFRLKFNVLQLYTYKVFIGEIKTLLETIKGVYCVPSPSIIGFVDIFIDYDIIKNVYDKCISGNTLNRYDILNTYYKEIVTSKFDETISGPMGALRVNGMKNARVNEVSVMQIFEGREIKEGDNWRLYGNATELRLRGVRDEKIRKLFKECGINVIEGEYNPGIVSYLVSHDTSPLKHIESLTQDAADKFNAFRDKTFETSSFDLSLDFEGGDIYRASKYCSAVAQTDQLKKVLVCDGIDPNMTYLENPYKMHLMYGIEAGRNMLLRLAWNNIVDSGNSISARNLHVVVESMCYKETIIPTTSKGAAKLGRETWSNACFDTPLDHIRNAAIAGKVEPVRSTSSCILFGTQVKMGTGLSEIKEDKEIPIETFSKDSARKMINSSSIDLDLDIAENAFVRNATNKRFSSSNANSDPLKAVNVSDRMSIDFSALDLGFDEGDDDVSIPEYDEDFTNLDELFD